MSVIVSYLFVLYQALPYVLLSYVLVKVLIVIAGRRRLHRAVKSIPGPPPRWPLIGNLDLFWDRTKGLNFTIMERLCALAKVYQTSGIFKLYIGEQPVVYLFSPDTVQSVLANNRCIDKSHEYSMIECWLGKGLGTRNGDSWRERRKILGPSFHFNILKDFAPIINEQSRIFCDVLAKKNDSDDISQLSINCALDIICETAMGVKLNTQSGTLNAYASALHRFTEIFVVRIMSPWLWPEAIFFNTSMGREMTKQIDILHNFTRGVIRSRKHDVMHVLLEMFNDNGNSKSEQSATTDKNNNNDDLNDVGGGTLVEPQTTKRLAFLDLLIKLHLEGMLTEEEVREEVDMFTFAGHDTTGISIAFAMFCIGLHGDVQERLHEEIDTIFENDTDRAVTADDLRRMNYLECVIKESLRLYPAGPFFARYLAEDVVAGGHLLPKGTVAWLCIAALHMNPDAFPEPERFNPDRFTSNQARHRHPYAYLPFSGGPRACLGQRFAMMEEKIVLANVLRRFNLRTIGTPDKLVLASEIILRPKSAIRVICEPRSNRF